MPPDRLNAAEHCFGRPWNSRFEIPKTSDYIISGASLFHLRNSFGS